MMFPMGFAQPANLVHQPMRPILGQAGEEETADTPCRPNAHGRPIHRKRLARKMAESNP